ncbi:MAG: hypothetical protein RR219_06155 [Clostridiales bacterium]
MLLLILGSLSFLLFFVYDINSVKKNNRLFHHFFWLGCSVILIATICLFIGDFSVEKIMSFRGVFFSILGIIAFVLLIYTLFFALPFDKTYVDAHSVPKVCDVKIYALCRHPGVIWFFLFYLFAAIALKSINILWAAIIWSFLNVLYVTYQDKVTFVINFANYDEYKKTTPFLIPNKGSIKRCFDTWK